MKIAKKFLIMAALSLSTAFDVLSQNNIIMVKPFGGDNWGYANIKGEMVIPATYRKCFAFSEGLAVVFNEQTKKFMILKPNGEQLKTQVENFEVRSGLGIGDVGFSDGLLPV